MTKQEIFELMQKNPAFYLATTEGDQPHVRGMLLFKADEEGIIFHTAETKDLFKQISTNPKVELCFNGGGTQVRVKGVVQRVDDPAVIEAIYNHPTRQFLRNWKAEGIEFQIAVYCLKGGQAVTWTMAQNFDKKVPIDL